MIEEIRAKLEEERVSIRHTVESDISAIKNEYMADWIPILQSEEEPISYFRIIQEINKNVDLENSIVTHDAGAPRDSMVPFHIATTPHSYIGWGKTTHLGFGIPLMIGAKMAEPKKFCLNLMGDGAFGMSGTDIETAVRSGAAITTIVLNNSAMATYSGRRTPAIGQEAREFCVSIMHGDYAKIAEGMGAIGIKVRKVADIAKALQNAQKLNSEGKTVLIDILANIEERESRF